MTKQSRGVLLLIADDWSPIAGCYGDTVVRTPAVDRLARDGCTFERAFCVAPSCAASRASLLTGQYTHQHGQYGHCHGAHGFRTREGVVTLPAWLNRFEIRSALIGKHHTAPDAAYPYTYRPRVRPGSRLDLLDHTRRFVDDVADAPFFAMVASTYPHRCGDETGWGLSDFRDEHEDVPCDPDTVPLPGFLPDHPEVRRDLAGYYGAISRWDQLVGGVLEALEQAGRADDTLVLVLSDHGLPFPGAKASSFEGGHHVPLVVRAPGVRGDVRCDALVNWCDLFPSICDWLGQAPPDGLRGRSILPLLDGGHHDNWDATFYSHCFHEVRCYYPYRALRERRFKYVRNLAHEQTLPLPSDLYRSRTWQTILGDGPASMGGRSVDDMLHQPPEALYDLERDPHETSNLIDDPAFAEVATRMRRTVMAWRIETRDPWLEDDYQRGDPLLAQGGPPWRLAPMVAGEVAP